MQVSGMWGSRLPFLSFSTCTQEKKTSLHPQQGCELFSIRRIFNTQLVQACSWQQFHCP